MPILALNIDEDVVPTPVSVQEPDAPAEPASVSWLERRFALPGEQNLLDNQSLACQNWHIMSTGTAEDPKPLFWMGPVAQYHEERRAEEE